MIVPQIYRSVRTDCVQYGLMTFEWERYNLAKIAAHSLTLNAVEAVISDPASITIEQQREADEESRNLTVGYVAGKRIAAVWTLRGEIVRPITAWPESRARKRS